MNNFKKTSIFFIIPLVTNFTFSCASSKINDFKDESLISFFNSHFNSTVKNKFTFKMDLSSENFAAETSDDSKHDSIVKAFNDNYDSNDIEYRSNDTEEYKKYLTSWSSDNIGLKLNYFNNKDTSVSDEENRKNVDTFFVNWSNVNLNESNKSSFKKKWSGDKISVALKAMSSLTLEYFNKSDKIVSDNSITYNIYVCFDLFYSYNNSVYSEYHNGNYTLIINKA